GQFLQGKPLDFVALAAFLLTALVATDLLVRAQTQAEEANRRAVEIASLAKLGSETLSAGRAEDALARIAEAIRATLRVSERSIIAWDKERGFGRATGLATVGPTGNGVAEPESVLLRALESPGPSWVRSTGEIVHPSSPDQRGPTTLDQVHKIFIPLSVQGRPVGLLTVASEASIQFDASQRRFIDAIAYYAALAADRVRLV